MKRHLKLVAAAYARYLVGYSTAKHSIIISVLVILSTFPFMYLYLYLVDFTSLSKAESWIWSITGPTMIWIFLLFFIGLSLRLASAKRDEERYVKAFQYSFSLIALFIFLVCLDVSQEKGVTVLILIFEIPALIFVASHATLSVITGQNLGVVSWLSLMLTTTMVSLSLLKVY